MWCLTCGLWSTLIINLIAEVWDIGLLFDALTDVVINVLAGLGLGLLAGLMFQVDVALEFDVLADVNANALAATMIALEFAMAVPQFVDVLEDVLMHALTDVTIGVLPDIGVAGLADVNADISTVVMAVLEFIMSTPLGEFSC